jgi:rubrerythrin
MIPIVPRVFDAYAMHHRAYEPYSMPREMDESIAIELERAVQGECHAIACYTHLMELAPSAIERAQIGEIIADEQRHAQQFSKMYTFVTNRQPTPRQIDECPKTYRAGLEAAIVDEQKTADAYRDLAERTMSPSMREMVLRAAADEQNHAVWFVYFLLRLKE